MKKYLVLIIIAFIVSCSEQPKEVKEQTNEEIIIGERIDGPANIRDTINGKIIFELYDNAYVETTELKNDWYIIGIAPSNGVNDYTNENFIKKGTELFQDNKPIGKAIEDVEVTIGAIGYTHKSNIKPESIIENVLKKHLKTKNSRAFENLETIINQFQLSKTEQFDDYEVYYNYENWIDDPSPMYRIGLIFNDKKLVAVLHSRPLAIKNTKTTNLERAFDCSIYNDVLNADEIVKLFNHFVNSVD